MMWRLMIATAIAAALAAGPVVVPPVHQLALAVLHGGIDVEL